MTSETKFESNSIDSRANLIAALNEEKAKLEQLRVKEELLRMALALKVELLAIDATRACFKIQTREWADGATGLDQRWEAMKNAETALTDCLKEIAYSGIQIADTQRTLDDAKLWEAQ